MEKPKTVERIEKMRNGEKLKCPKCKEGYISAVGDPETTLVFRCSGCDRSIVLTVNIFEDNK